MPGEFSEGRIALNTSILSNHIFEKTVKIGYKNWSNLIDYEVKFTVPENENIIFQQFEALTGYMPSEFDSFYILRGYELQQVKIQDVHGEQAYPVIVSNTVGSHAMGAWSPDEPSVGFEGAGYGIFRFPEQKVNKWNVVFRKRTTIKVVAKSHTFHIFVAIGSLKDVEKTIRELSTSYHK